MSASIGLFEFAKYTGYISKTPLPFWEDTAEHIYHEQSLQAGMGDKYFDILGQTPLLRSPGPINPEQAGRNNAEFPHVAEVRRFDDQKQFSFYIRDMHLALPDDVKIQGIVIRGTSHYIVPLYSHLRLDYSYSNILAATAFGIT